MSDKTQKTQKTDEDYKAQLSAEEFRVARQAGTERAFTGRYWDHTQEGTYRCVCCQTALFSSDAKFESGCGWPSFSAPAAAAAVTIRSDTTHGMLREEALCSECDAHLGHRFPDGPPPTGIRFCINSASLAFEAKER